MDEYEVDENLEVKKVVDGKPRGMKKEYYRVDENYEITKVVEE